MNQRPTDYKSVALPTELRQRFGYLWSGKRDSNPQPTAWKAAALPVELFPPIFHTPLPQKSSGDTVIIEKNGIAVQAALLLQAVAKAMAGRQEELSFVGQSPIFLIKYFICWQSQTKLACLRSYELLQAFAELSFARPRPPQPWRRRNKQRLVARIGFEPMKAIANGFTVRPL